MRYAALISALFWAFPSPASAYEPGGSAASTALLIFSGAAWAALVAAPFIPGLLELLRPRDTSPLNINWNFLKDPFYFFNSFRALMLAKSGEFPLDSGTVEIKLSKPEKVDVLDGLKVSGPARSKNLVYVKGSFSCGARSLFYKEVYCMGYADAGDGSIFRAFGAEGGIKLGDRVFVARWIACEGPLTAGEETILGASAASRSSIVMGAGCQFRSVFAPEITADGGSTPPPPQDFPGAAEPPAGKIAGDVVTRVPVRLKKGTELKGSVKGGRGVVVEDGVIVRGGIFSEGDIFIGRNCLVEGNVFSQGSVTLGDGSTVGRAGAVKSLVAKRNVLLGGGAKVFGCVNSIGGGRVAAKGADKT